MQARTLVAITILISGCGGSDSSTSAASGSTSSGSAQSGSSMGATATTDVLTYHYDNMRTGQTLTETELTPATVTSSSFGKLRLLPTDDPVDAAPLVATNVTIGGSTHTVVYVATEHDTLYAFDVDSGAPLLQVSLLPSGETPSDTHGCALVLPEIGITATPV